MRRSHQHQHVFPMDNWLPFQILASHFYSTVMFLLSSRFNIKISWCHERAFEKKLSMPIGYVRNKSLTRNLFTLPHSGNTNSLLSTFPPPLTVLLGRAFGQRSSS